MLHLYSVVWSSSPQNNVYMYYGLSNFYQNHRRYVKSRDDKQLNGDSGALTVNILIDLLYIMFAIPANVFSFE